MQQFCVPKRIVKGGRILILNNGLRQTHRFSDKAEFYAKYRPKYPKEIVKLLINREYLSENTVIADIGSGTGLLSKLFLDSGNKVYSVEPNDDMREYSEKFLERYNRFTSVKGTAEETHLLSNSIGLVAVGQAFHWFDPIKTKREFKRILIPNGHAVLIWNKREISGTLYGNFLSKYSEDYEKVKSITVDND